MYTVKYKLPSWALCAVLLVIVGLSSCGGSRRAYYTTGAAVSQNKQAILEKILEYQSAWSSIKGNVQAEINFGAKSFSSRVNLNAVRGSGIRLSVVPFPLVEAARIWFTPEGITFVDVLNGRYAEESYQTFSERIGFVLDYTQIEALLFGSVFTPEEGISLAALNKLNYLPIQGTDTHSLSGRGSSYRYAFTLGSDAVPNQFVVSNAQDEKVFQAEYSERISLDKAVFPHRSTFSLLSKSGNPRGSLILELGRITQIDNRDAQPIRPNVKSSYQRISLDQILSMLDKL